MRNVDTRPSLAWSAPAAGRLCWCGVQADYWIEADPAVTPDTVECRETWGSSVWCAPRCTTHAIQH